MSDLAQALMVAIRVHSAQTDRQGEPYLLHILRVVEAVSDDAKAVAALHDVWEDGDPGVEALAPCQLNEIEWQALALLTHDKDEDYAHYIARIADEGARTWMIQEGVLLAREVKLADLRDNLGRIPPRPHYSEIGCLGSLVFGAEQDIIAEWDAKWASLSARYEKAIETLEAATVAA